MKGLGVAVCPRLEAIKDLANLLKHTDDKRGADLLKSWPEVLPSSFQKGETRTDWYEAVKLTDANLEEAFSAAAASGPDAKTVYT